jgi:hypothetical protein
MRLLVEFPHSYRVWQAVLANRNEDDRQQKRRVPAHLDLTSAFHELVAEVAIAKSMSLVEKTTGTPVDPYTLRLPKHGLAEVDLLGL